MSNELTKEDWICRCAVRYLELTSLCLEHARALARLNYEESDARGNDAIPEEVAEDNVDSWTESELEATAIDAIAEGNTNG